MEIPTRRRARSGSSPAAPGAEAIFVELAENAGWDPRRAPAGQRLRAAALGALARPGLRAPDVALGIAPGTPALAAWLLPDAGAVALEETVEAIARALPLAEVPLVAAVLAPSPGEAYALRVLGPDGRVLRREGAAIAWLPGPAAAGSLIASRAPTAEAPPPALPPEPVLAARADALNRLLREARVKDEYRPAVAAALLVALASGAPLRRDRERLLRDVNAACTRAFSDAGRADLAGSLRVDERSAALAEKAPRLLAILERLGAASHGGGHDYLGQLYETFFQYTGGNTIGQYFTPRHVTAFMAGLAAVRDGDVVLDPACGTGGFLVAAHACARGAGALQGCDAEPTTAALAAANLLLRGIAAGGVRAGDALGADTLPIEGADVVLMNPPFPHRATDAPPEAFVTRALEALRPGGRLAAIVPASVLLRDPAFRRRTLARHTLEAAIALPDELFQPWAAANTAVLVLGAGRPHPAGHPVFFARVENDGRRLRKRVRVARPGGQLDAVREAYARREAVPGLCCIAAITEGAEWSPGAWLPAAPLDPEALVDEVAALLRVRAAAVVRNAPALIALQHAIDRGSDLPREYVPAAAREEHARAPGTLGGAFAIYYGQHELERKEDLPAGPVPVVSSSGAECGWYGFHTLERWIRPPVVTVPRTGSIGEAHVQLRPSGISSDCLVLAPREPLPVDTLYAVAALVRRERWRFSYGRKVTPPRLAELPMPLLDAPTRARLGELIARAARIEALALEGG